MTVRPAADRSVWDAFLVEAKPPSFLQCWAWGETQRALGEEVVRLIAEENGEIVGIAQAVTVTARRGKFLHVPHGPCILSGTNTQEIFKNLLHSMEAHVKDLQCSFLRVSPIQEDSAEHRELYRSLGFRPAPIYLHAEQLWVLDLAPSEEELLTGMRKTTRNLVRRAEREDVAIDFSTNPEDLENFFRLYRETSERERFVPFSEKLIRAELECFAPYAVIALAKQSGEALSGALAVFTPWSGFYHHGASTRLRQSLPAGRQGFGGQARQNVSTSSALQWALIREAKRRGCAQYNFWGIYQASNPRYGITVFKTGFGGREVRLVPTQDLPLSNRYWMTYAIDRVRRLYRRM